MDEAATGSGRNNGDDSNASARRARAHDDPSSDGIEWDLDLRKRTAEVLLETLPAIMAFVSSELRRESPVDNPVHFRLLRTLRHGDRNLHELAELQSVRLPTMSRTVSVLEGRGWVDRVRSEGDRRTVYAHLTETGSAVLAEVERMAIDRGADLLACLDDDEVRRLQAGMEPLFRVIRERLGPNADVHKMNMGGCG